MATETREKTGVDRDFEPLREKIKETMERLKVPGVSLGIMVDGQEHVAAFGVTNVDYPSPVSEDTLFQIGSTTKTMTATVVMQLVEAGKIDLDATVRTYLPDLRLIDETVAQTVTIRQLMNHMAGWTGDYFADFGRGDDALARIVSGMAEIEQVTPLGTIWSYNNAAFYLAGRVIEAITEESYENAVKEMLLVPLGMTNSFFFPEEVMLRSFSVGHSEVEGKISVASPWPIPRSANPAGGLSSTAGDQLRYARFHMGDGTAEDGTRILEAESIRLMQTPTVDAWEGARMGLSWFIRNVQGTKILAHGGTTNGQHSAFLFAPERNFAFTSLTNVGAGARLNDEVAKWALEEYLGIAEPEPVHEARTLQQLEEYAGEYTSTVAGLGLTIEDDSLVLKYTMRANLVADTAPPPPPPTRLVFYGQDRVIALDGPFKNVKGEFLRGTDGEIAWLRIGGRIHRRQR
ncbi:MAG: serine hydrolase domain-containing protein [Chloroflexota bacterium]